MPRRLKDYLIILSTGLCLSTAVPATQTAPERYSLLSRAGIVQLDVQLDPAQRQWLQNKRELVLGTSIPNCQPIYITTTLPDY